jgi:hypothetical protein
MADKPSGPFGIYITSPPSGKKPPLTGIRAYITYIVYGLVALGAIKLASVIVGWFQ